MKKIDKRKVAVAIIMLIVIVIAIVIVGRWILKPKEILEESVSNETNIIEEQNSEKTNVEDEQSGENEEKVVDKNNLAEDVASFGDLAVPVYKKDEKNIKIPLLIYHGFCTPEPEDDVYKLMCSKDRFEDQITTLLDAGYTFLTLEDIYKYNNGTIGLPEKNVTITMDDGWEGNYTEAFEIIKKYEVPATIFIVEELVGTTGYFTWDQAKEMYDTGLVKIHVHGRQHVAANNLTKEKLIEDYNHTHSKIEEALGAKVQKIMAYPAGESSENSIKWLKEAGFEVQVQTKYGTVNKSASLDLTGLGRIRAEKASGASILKTIENAKTE